MPHSGCKDADGASLDLYAEYAAVRGEGLAIPRDDLLPITDTLQAPGQACSTFGLHPRLTEVQTLFGEGAAALFANVGALAEPITKAEFKAKTKPLPLSLFAHNAQQACMTPAVTVACTHNLMP